MLMVSYFRNFRHRVVLANLRDGRLENFQKTSVEGRRSISVLQADRSCRCRSRYVPAMALGSSVALSALEPVSEAILPSIMMCATWIPSG